jgi:hypothetical protein
VKRGLITWDKNEIAPSVFAERIEALRKVLRTRNLPAGIAYSDLWRSNQVRSLQNFSPYFNRALLVVPVEGETVLLCGLSPRVYKWIQSVTPITEVRPGKNFAGPLEAMATERGWSQVGVIDEAGLPFDVHAALMNTHMELVDITAEDFACPMPDATELTMRRKSVAMARVVLESEIGFGAGRRDYELIGHLEQTLRRAGAEDLIMVVGHGGNSPAPPTGASLEDEFSVSVAVEYRGHWTRISRVHAGEARIGALHKLFESTLEDGTAQNGTDILIEDLSSGYPYAAIETAPLDRSRITAFHVINGPGQRHLVYGDTCVGTETGWSLL